MAAQSRRHNALGFRRILLAGTVTFISSATALVAAATATGPAIADLLTSGWQIAGYSQAFDNRSTFILFRHSEQTYLVQCRVGYDVTRNPNVYSICYELR